MENQNEIGQMLVSGALDRTKKIRKTAADIFAKSGPEKPWKNLTNQIFSGIFLNFPVDLAQSRWVHVQTAGSHINLGAKLA